jgi:hypothetical protein
MKQQPVKGTRCTLNPDPLPIGYIFGISTARSDNQAGLGIITLEVEFGYLERIFLQHLRLNQ